MNPLFLSTLLLGLVGVVGLVEHALYGGMNRAYYTHGLPFIILRVPVAAPQDIPPLAPLEVRFRSGIIGSLMFHEVAPCIYGFRRAFFRPALFPGNLMHGMLHFDREHKQVVLKGFLNAWITLLALAVIVFALLGPLPGRTPLLPIAIVVLVVGVPLVLERQRCVEVARAAAAAWDERAAHGFPRKVFE